MNILQRWTRPPERDLSFSDYLTAMFNYGGNTYTPTQTYTPNGELVGSEFGSYVAQAYQANGIVFACVLSRALLFSEARFQYQQMRNGKPGDLFGTPDLDILEHPWPNGTTGELLTKMEQHASMAGNAFIHRRPDRQLELLRPDWVTIATATTDDTVRPDLVGYLYAPPGGDPGAARTFPAGEVAHFSPIPDPLTHYRGMSWLTPILREIDADSQATLHKLQFFRNGATPNMVVKFDASIDAERAKVFKELLETQHQGAVHAYKTLYLGGGADATVVGSNFRQLDFKVTQGAGETRVAAAAGVPPIIVGLSEGLAAATYSNFGQARRKFADHWARPQWRTAAAALTAIVPVPAGARLWYDATDIAFLQEDAKDDAEIQSQNAQTIKALIDAGYKPDAVIDAVVAGDLSRLSGQHTDLFSVQLQPPGQLSPNGSVNQ
jgi:HK97 family phage portal protein